VRVRLSSTGAGTAKLRDFGLITGICLYVLDTVVPL
jgi:hypothetical protein